MDIPQLPVIKTDFTSKEGDIISTTIDGLTIARVKVFIGDDGRILCEAERSGSGERWPRSFDFVFVCVEGWEVSVEGCHIYKNNYPSNFMGTCIRLNAKRGRVDSEDIVQYFTVVERFEFEGDIVPGGGIIAGPMQLANEFKPSELSKLALIKGCDTFLPEATSYFYTKAEYGSLDAYKEVFDNLYYLLSFAAGHYVKIGLTYIKKDGVYDELRYSPSTDDASSGSGNLYLKYPGTVGNFINTCYDNYVRLKDNLKLYRLIHYYIMMLSSSFLTTQYLSGSVLMEGLKYYYAKDYAGLDPIINSETGKIKGFRKTNGTPYIFQEIVELVYNEFGITNGNTDFIDFRNEVVHTGYIDYPLDELIEKSYKFREFIGYMLLKIMGYDGLVWNTEAREWVEFSTLDIFN